MKTGIFKRGLSAFMAMLLCLSMVANISTATAYAATNQAEVFVISFPREVIQTTPAIGATKR